MTSTNGRTLDLSTENSEKDTIKPIAPGEYEFVVNEASVKQPKEPFNEKGVALPYVRVDITLFGGALKETGRKFTTNLFLGMKPGADDKLNYKRPNGLLAMFESLGASKPAVSIIDHVAVRDDGTEESAEVINPTEVADIINTTLRGQRGKLYLRVKTEVYKGQKQDKNEVVRFVVPMPEAA